MIMINLKLQNALFDEYIDCNLSKIETWKEKLQVKWKEWKAWYREFSILHHSIKILVICWRMGYWLVASSVCDLTLSVTSDRFDLYFTLEQ